MCLLFLAGTIFPQGESVEDYVKAGGKYILLVRTFDLLDVFMSPLFIASTCILLVNLAVCLYDRLGVFLRSKRKGLDLHSLKNHPKVLAFKAVSSGGSSVLESRISGAGFALKSVTADSVKLFEKGLPFWWLSWLYHVGIILAIVGFFLTALFAFEKEVTLFPGKPESISLYSDETRWNRFLKWLGKDTSRQNEGHDYVLTLKEFRTEYYQGLRIDYPKDKFERFLVGIGQKNIEPSKQGFSYMPKMWLTSLEVRRPDGKVQDAELWVNRPFRTSQLTLYQMGYEQKMVLLANGEKIETEARVPFMVKGVKGKFILDQLRVGTLFKKDGSSEAITPFTFVSFMPEDKPSVKEPVGELKLGGTIDVKGNHLALTDYTEGSSLSYRKDPGVLLVGLACLFVFLGLFVRSLGAWYRIQYADEGETAYVLVSTRGILADRDRIINKLRE